MSTRFADQVASARRRDFVGRAAELAGFARLLAGDGGALVWVSGPGGVGKTSLLHQFADLAGRSGRTVVWLDERVPEGDGLVVLADEAVETDLLAALPADAVVAVASRAGPPVQYRIDPGWSSVLHTMPLVNLDEVESALLLTRRGVPAAAHADAMAFTHGHPLALALIADVRAQRREPAAPAGGPEVVATLLAALLDAVPSPAHRLALDAVSQVAVTTEPLLAELLDLPDAHELFEWLRGLSVMAASSHGLVLHDLAREVLARDLRWRHPELHATIHHRAGGSYRRRFAGAAPDEQRRILLDFAFLHRDNPVIGAFLQQRPSGDLRVVTAGPHRWPALREMVRRHEGAAEADLFDHWCRDQPEAVHAVVDAEDTAVGLAVLLTLHAPDPRDPAAAAAWRRGAPAAGEAVSLLRFWLDAEEYQQPSPVQALISLHAVRHYLITPGLGYSLIYHADPGLWAPMCEYVGFARVEDADFVVDGRRYAGFGHDWRRMPRMAWLSMLISRETSGEPAAPEPSTVSGPLDRAAFTAAVRAALREWGRLDRLATSPLLSARLLARASGGRTAEALRAVVEEAAATLADSPRDRSAYRALHHTYLQPAGTQQAAADLLRLPMSTYRRHLAAGVERLTEILWQRESAVEP
ncbi:ATP-binding protein [Actinoplanes sp. NPDC051475]|uniref:ATP-binding protein n=1 Tax=Actinoplanes sp. NPDC051475 TaxID=3157225 RepID=UPI00344E162E